LCERDAIGPAWNLTEQNDGWVVCRRYLGEEKDLAAIAA